MEIGLLVWFGFAFWNRKLKEKKNCGNMLVSLVSASLVWSCLLEYKINQNKKRSKRGNWPSSLVWLCLLEKKKKKTWKFVGIINFSQFSLVFLFEIEN